MSTQQTAHPSDDEIDLRELVAVLWHEKVLIVAAGLFGGALGLGASLLSTQYVTDSVLQAPSISANTYKRYQSVLTSGLRLQQFLKASNQDSTPDGKLLFALAENTDRLAEIIRPEFAFTDRDSKAFGIKINAEDPGAMIGIHIHFTHKTPTNGTPVPLLAEFVRDSIIRIDMESLTLEQCSSLSIREQELRNAQLEASYAISEEEQRVNTLRDIIARTPNASSIDNRQIVSLEKGSERFLSPTAQLVAAEVKIADMRLAEARRERERSINTLKRDYYCTAHQTLQQTATGLTFLAALPEVQDKVFQEHDKSQDIIEQTWNELNVERERWNSTYLHNMRFITSPEGTETRVRKPRLAIGLALGGILGGMLGMFGALVRTWWRGGKDSPSDKA